MYRAYSKDPVLNAAENGAHQLKSGLWSQPNPVAPWLFRKQPKAPAKSVAPKVAN
jgi:hypothetical protein